MPDFADFLDAKFDLDERSLAPGVRRECFASIARRDALRCLDIGTGTGAMVRRLLDAELRPASFEIVVLDRDPLLLERARAALADDLARRRIGLHSVCCDVARFAPRSGERYDLITAHAFMDLVPMRPLVERIAAWLAPGGLFYATSNYDGETALLPQYVDAVFEASLLERYDASMEERRVEGEPTGGAHSGRRLHTMLHEAGFEIVTWASSDWNIVPHRGRLHNGDALVLSVLLDAIRRENEAHGDAQCLADWYRDRCASLEAGRLGAIVHQIDVLAAAPAAESAGAHSDRSAGSIAFT